MNNVIFGLKLSMIICTKYFTILKNSDTINKVVRK